MLEVAQEAGFIDLYYSDVSRVSEVGYVPYGWQFDDEDVSIEVARGKAINCWGLLSRSNHLIFETSEANINSQFILEQLDAFSLTIKKPTVVVLDNARVHTARKIKERFSIWQERGLYIFYLPPYSPHLNIIERLWKELKGRWLKPSDYASADALFYAVTLALAAVGNELFINFGSFAK